MQAFSDAAALRQWLQARGIPVERYGMGPAKSVDQLFEEVQRGESVLDIDGAGEVCRHVAVASVWIHDDRGRVLIEVAQQLPTGQRRERRRALSEKILPGERWDEGALRGIKEELGSILPSHHQIELDRESHTVTEESRTSLSYPGLKASYTLHRLRARVRPLPASAFATQERHGNGLLISFWDWVPEETFRSERSDGL